MAKITVTFTPAARDQMRSIPCHIQEHLMGTIRAKAPHGHEQMIVLGMTYECPDHVYRAFKSYAFSPGHRIVFHFEGDWNHIVIDVVARRDCHPYGPGSSW